MAGMYHVLSVTGSDGCGITGVQADVRTVSALGGYPLTAVTSVVVQTPEGISEMFTLPPETVVRQVSAAMKAYHPQVVKVGMVDGYDTVRLLRNEIVACRHRIVAPSIVSSRGERMVSDDTVRAVCSFLIPEATLCILRCRDAEEILHCTISTKDDMTEAARRLCEMGAESVLLRGAAVIEGFTTTLFFDGKEVEFFSSHNVDGWQQHGISGAMSSAIATCLAMGDILPVAIRHAHAYLHSQVVYALSPREERGQRPADIYNAFMSLIAREYSSHHDVSFYASQLAISQQYLSRVTAKTVGKTPKEIIDEYLVHEAVLLLTTSRLTIQEVSQKLGFSSQATFCRFYKAQTGETPSEGRK